MKCSVCNKDLHGHPIYEDRQAYCYNCFQANIPLRRRKFNGKESKEKQEVSISKLEIYRNEQGMFISKRKKQKRL